MTSDRHLAGVVLAGGYSRRFGEADKAVADLAGTALIRRVVDRLEPVADELVVNCRADQLRRIRESLSDGPDVGYAVDPIPDRGPVAGIRAGLVAVDAPYAAVLACDMPFVDPAVLSTLAVRGGGRDGAVVRLESGRVQPLGAVYRVDAMASACESTLAVGDRRLRDALDRLDLAVVDGTTLGGVDETTFESIDTRAALEAASTRLGPEP